MSSLRFASPDALLDWLRKLAADCGVFAPGREGSSVVFRRRTAEKLTDLSVLLLRGTASPKDAVMPRSEPLVRFSSRKDGQNPALLHTVLEAPCEAAPAVLFGGRPCDARGFAVLDRPYLRGRYKDPYYAGRRESTLIITQACPSPFPACFCNWVGSHPADSAGSDIVFTAVEGGFVLEAFSDRGETFLRASGLPEGDARKEEADEAQQAARRKLPPSPLPEDVPARLAARFADEAFWENETVKCLSCGACTYLCPTCQCFTITDEGSPMRGVRLRSWDSCMSPRFTLEASGHNPRPEKFKRMRNRVSHKFSYYPQAHDGEYSCCGCGRCVIGCPVSLDIRRLVRAAAEGADIAADAVADVAANVPETAAKPAATGKSGRSGSRSAAPRASRSRSGKEGS
jgi:ferredoxin